MTSLILIHYWWVSQQNESTASVRPAVRMPSDERRADFGSVYKSLLSLSSAFPTAIENKRKPAAAAAAARALEESCSVFKQTEITLMPEWQEEKHN